MYLDPTKEEKIHSYQTSIVDALRLPILNVKNQDAFAYYTAFDDSRMAHCCLANFDLNETYYNSRIPMKLGLNCSVAPDDRNLYYDARCRPWYKASY